MSIFSSSRTLDASLNLAINLEKEMMDMDPIDVNVDMKKLTQQIVLEKNFELDNRTRKKENQTTISDFI